METGITIVRPTADGPGGMEIVGKNWNGDGRLWTFGIDLADLDILGRILERYVDDCVYGMGYWETLVQYTWGADDPRQGHPVLHSARVTSSPDFPEDGPIHFLLIAPPDWRGSVDDESQAPAPDCVVELELTDTELAMLAAGMREIADGYADPDAATRITSPCRVVGPWKAKRPRLQAVT